MAWMMAAAAVSAIGGIVGNRKAKESAREAEELGENQAKLIEAEGFENMRRMQLNADQALGQARASIGASNIMMSGTMADYTRNLEYHYQEDIEWLERTTAADAELARAGGYMTGREIKSSGQAQLLQGIGQGIGYLA